MTTKKRGAPPRRIPLTVQYHIRLNEKTAEKVAFLEAAGFSRGYLFEQATSTLCDSLIKIYLKKKNSPLTTPPTSLVDEFGGVIPAISPPPPIQPLSPMPDHPF